MYLISNAICWSFLLLVPFSSWGLPPDDAFSAQQRIQQLEKEIAHHDDLYFRKAAPVISDHEYDSLVRELAELRNAAGQEPEERGVPDDRTGRFADARHDVPMLSLRKADTTEELTRSYLRMADALDSDELEFFVEPKIDGMAISAVYEKGRLIRVVSRGNGREGEVLTPNFGIWTGLPMSLTGNGPFPDLIELRGEAYIPLDTFERINADRAVAGEQPFSTPRNLAAGTARLEDSEKARARGLRVAIFGWGAWLPEQSEPPDHTAFEDRLRKWGLPSASHGRVVRGLDDLHKTVLAMEKEHRLWNIPADGLVVKIHDTRQRKLLGTAARSPNWAVAWKFPPPHAETRLLGITWQEGETGRLTPVAELAPVEIDGRTVTRASLYNRDFLEREGYAVGDRVRVILAGDVIPALDGIVRRGD